MKLLQRLSNKAPRSIYVKTAPSPISSGKNKNKLLIQTLEEDMTATCEEPSDSKDLTAHIAQKVYFDETKNQVHEADPSVEIDETLAAACWYPKMELQLFYQNAQQEGRQMAAHQHHDDSLAVWAKSLMSAFNAFCNVQSADDMNYVLAATLANPEPIAAYCVGLDPYAIPALHAARSARRQDLLRQVARVQRSCLSNSSRTERAKRLRKLSHAASRPARLLAMHIASRVQEA